jgi:hypothetical protein
MPSTALPTNQGMKKLRIAQIGTLFEPITDSSTNGLPQIVYILTEELVALGHEVTLYAPAGSSSSGTLVPLSAFEYASETILGKVITIAAAFQDWRNFDVIHDHRASIRRPLLTCFRFPSFQRFITQWNLMNSTGITRRTSMTGFFERGGNGCSRG